MRFCECFFLLSLCAITNGVKILGLFAHPSISHFAVFEPLLKGLSEKGHSVTVLGPFPSTETTTNYKNVVVKFPGDELKSTIDIDNLRLPLIECYLGVYFAFVYARWTCEAFLSSSEYQQLLNSDEEYDLIIAEYFISGCAFLPFVEKHKVPVIGIQSHSLMPWHHYWVGNPNNPAYIPSIYTNNGEKMSFLKRVANVVFDVGTSLFKYFVITKYDFDLIERHLDRRIPTDNHTTALILTNTHFSLQRAKPLVPNVVEISGIHIGKAQKLPKHLEKWINESTHGVIYFSLGSMIKGHTFPEEKRQMFLRAFARFPQRVLWKWETDTMPGKPENVMIEKWMPQFDILSHPNVKAYIAHGGLLGVTEAVHCGVPLIIMPQFGDQSTNAKAVETNGGGVILDYRSLDEESIYNALKTALDPSFNKKAKALSARFRDRPMPPLETAIYWVEYVARHGGAPHLRTAAVGMPLYQYLLLDVVAFLAAILSTVMYISFIVTRSIFRRIFKTNKKEKVKKN